MLTNDRLWPTRARGVGLRPSGSAVGSLVQALTAPGELVWFGLHTVWPVHVHVCEDQHDTNHTQALHPSRPSPVAPGGVTRLVAHTTAGHLMCAWESGKGVSNATAQPLAGHNKHIVTLSPTLLPRVLSRSLV